MTAAGLPARAGACAPVSAARNSSPRRGRSCPPGGPGQLLIGDDPGLRVRRQMRPVAVAAGLRRLAGMPGIRVDGADHAILGDLAGDPPPPVGAVGALGGLDILPGDQGQQRQRGGGGLIQLRVPERRYQGVGVVDQGGDQRVLRGRVIPVDLRLARLTVIVAGAHLRDLLRRAGHLPGHPPDRGDQLGDGVLRGHRIGQDRRVHRPAAPAPQHPGLLHDIRDRVVDPVRPLRPRDPAPPAHQRGRVEARVVDRRPIAEFHRTSNRTASAVCRSESHAAPAASSSPPSA